MDINLYVIYSTLLKYELPVNEILRRWENTQSMRDYSNGAVYPGAIDSERIELKRFFISLIMRARRSKILHGTYVRHSSIDYKDTISFLIRYSGSKINTSMADRAWAFAWHYYSLAQGISPRHIISTVIDRLIRR